MLFYKDARFSQDRIFTFFALNYITRHRNSTSGHFFVNSFQKGCPSTVEELKKKISDGDTSFINSLNYYNKRVSGSNAYWSHKRSEVYSWINHHVQVGNGAPMFFITLSCAEYYWKDIADIMRDRLEIAGQDTSECYVGSKGFATIVNDNCVVVQEYFQLRVEEWLNTVGKTVFDIKHHWLRYEFAPGRGQIHAHMLAIPNDQSIYNLAHEAGNKVTGPSKADILADWAAKKFNLTAEVKDGFDELNLEIGNTPTSLPRRPAKTFESCPMS